MSRKAYQVTRRSSGPSFKEAKNTAPSVVPQRKIAGFQAGNYRGCDTGATGPGTPCPKQKVKARGYNPPKDQPRTHVRKSGSGRKAGPSYTQGGTCSPSYGSGPSGLGRSGTKFPPIG